MQISGVQSQFDEKWEEDEEGCWIWTGSIWGNGYGQFSISGDSHQAHRISYRIYNGKIPPGDFVLHKCDVRACVNPDHLYTGSQSDNAQDMWDRDRHPENEPPEAPTGEDHPDSKLADEDVREIRDRYESEDCTQTELASEYGVTAGYISKLLAGDFRSDA
ncbi:HNH endonuclease [Halobacterium salinarum]|uniref:HNH endonuclease n=1 Tax=Halobacterium salinarum TaxID=2242 RepID=UPI002553A29E|nr:HNH endonuclease [Halobacterium salinarum]MDL0133571.1 HNH endonuclease [Halobacterium salinarum]